MDEANLQEAGNRKRRRRSVRHLRRRSDIIPPLNLNSVEEDPVNPDNGETVSHTEVTEEPTVYGSMWMESKSPIKKKRRRRSSLFTGLPARPLLREVETEQAAEAGGSAVIDCVADRKDKSGHIRQVDDAFDVNHMQTGFVDEVAKQMTNIGENIDLVCAEVSKNKFSKDKITKTPMTVMIDKEKVKLIDHGPSDSILPNDISPDASSQDVLLQKAECSSRKTVDSKDKSGKNLLCSQDIDSNQKSDNADVAGIECGKEISDKYNRTKEISNPGFKHNLNPIRFPLSPARLVKSNVNGNSESTLHETQFSNESTKSVEPINSLGVEDSDYEPLEKKQKRVWNVAVKQAYSASLEAVFNVQKFSPCSIGQKLEKLEEKDHNRRISSSASQKNQDLLGVLDTSTERNFSHSDPFNAGFVSDNVLSTPGAVENNSELVQSKSKLDHNGSEIDQHVLNDNQSLSKLVSPKLTDECVTPRSDLNISNSSASQGSMSPEYPGLNDIDQNNDKSMESMHTPNTLDRSYICEDFNSLENGTQLKLTVDSDCDVSTKVGKCKNTVVSKQVAVQSYDTSENRAFQTDENLPEVDKKTPDTFTQLVEKQAKIEVNREGTDINEISVNNESEVQADSAIEKKLNVSDHSSDKENSILIDPAHESLVVSKDNVALKPDTDRQMHNELVTEKQKESITLGQNDMIKQASKKSATQNATKALKVKKNVEAKRIKNMSTEKAKTSVTVRQNKLFKCKQNESLTVNHKELLTESANQSLTKAPKVKLVHRPYTNETLAIKQCELLDGNRNKKKPVKKSNEERKSLKVKSMKANRSVKVKEADVRSMREVVTTIAVNVVPQTIIVGAVTEASIQPSPQRPVQDMRVVTDIVSSVHEAVLERITDLRLSSSEGHLESDEHSPQLLSDKGCLESGKRFPEVLSEGCLKCDVSRMPVSANEVQLISDRYGSVLLGEVHLENDRKNVELSSSKSNTQSAKNYPDLGSNEGHLRSDGNIASKSNDEFVQTSATSNNMCSKNSEDDNILSQEKDLSKDIGDPVLDNVNNAKQTGEVDLIDKDVKVTKVRTKRRRSSRLTDILAFKTTENEKDTSIENNVTVESHDKKPTSIEQVSKPGPSKPKRRRSAKIDIVREDIADESLTETKRKFSDIHSKKGRRPRKSITGLSTQIETVTQSEKTEESPERSESLTQLTTDISQVTISEKTLEVLKETDVTSDTTARSSESDMSNQTNTELTVETLDLPGNTERPTTSRRKRRRSAETATLKIQLVRDDVKSSPECTQSPELGTKAVGAKSRKRKIVETPEIIEQIYYNKNYVKPEEHKPWVTIMEKADPSGDCMGKRKLQRFIDFDKPTQMKLRRRLQKARKNGWDPVKRHKTELKDDFVQVKLADLWKDLESEERELDVNSLQNKLKSIVETQ